MASDVPPVVIEFKGNIEGIQQSIKTIEGDLKKLQTKTKEAGNAGKDMSAKMVAAGAVMASVFQKVAGEVFKFAGETISKFQEVGTEVRKMQRVIGGSAEDASRLRFAGQELGVSNDQLIMGFKMLSTHLAKNDTAAKELGITYRDNQGNLLPMTTIMQNLSDRFSQMPAGVNRTALAVAAFGRSGLNMLPVLAKGKEGLADLYRESDKLGLTMSGKDLKAVKDYTLKQKELKASIEGAQIAIGRALMPALTGLVNYIQKNVVPWIQHFVNGLTGKDSLGGALGKTRDSAYKWGETLRGAIKWVKDFRYWILAVGTALGVVFVATKIITYVNSVITAFALLRDALALLRTSWLGVAAAEAAAAIAEAFVTYGTNIAAGAAALAVAGVALMGVYAYAQNDNPPTDSTQDPNAGKGITSPSRRAAARSDGAYRASVAKAAKKKPTTKPGAEYDPFAGEAQNPAQTLAQSLAEQVAQAIAERRLRRMGASAGLISAIMGSADWKKEYTNIVAGGKNALKALQGVFNKTDAGQQEVADARSKAASDRAKKFVKQHEASIKKIGQSAISATRQYDLDYSKEITTTGRMKVAKAYLKTLSPLISAAYAEEKKTRGTDAHTAAVANLNKLLNDQAKAQMTINRLIDKSTQSTKDNTAAIAALNRQHALLNTTTTASNSWLAAQVRTAGVTSAQQNSFIEVPVIIDGQTMFRVVQKHSLLNDRRNVSNGLARSGSTIG